jgi:hypothetical protein
MKQLSNEQELPKKQKLLKIYNDHFILTNIAISTVIVVIGYAITFPLIDLYAFLSNNANTFYSTLATIFGAFTGFIIASVAILLQLIYSKSSDQIIQIRVELLRKSKNYPKVYDVFLNTIKISGLTTLFSFSSLYLTTIESIRFLLFIFTSIFALTSALMIWSCILVLGKIIEIAVSPGEE